MKQLNPLVNSAKVNVSELERLQQTQAQLHMQGVDAELSEASFPLLTAKLASKDVSALKKGFLRRVFVEEIDSLEKQTKEFIARLTSKEAALPSQAWKLIHAARPEVVLWAAFTGKGAAVQNKFKAFYTDWPQARHKIPYAQMQEMRIGPEVANYDELLDKLFFALMDGKLKTPEEMKAFMEPYSPPAPPPTVHLRRPRAAKKESKAAKKKPATEAKEAAAVAAEAAAPVAPPAKTEKKPAPPAKAVKKPEPVKTKPAPAAPKPAAKKEPAKVSKPAPAKKKAVVVAASVKKAAVKAPAKKALPAKKVVPPKKLVAKKSAPKKPAPKKAAPKKKSPEKKSSAKKKR